MPATPHSAKPTAMTSLSSLSLESLATSVRLLPILKDHSGTVDSLISLGQARSSTFVRYGMVILEYDRTKLTVDDQHFTDSSLTVGAIRTVALKCFLNDLHFVETGSISDTVSYVERSSHYIGTDGGDRLFRPNPTRGAWGTRSSRDWSIHLLQSFPGIGPTTAAAIYDTVGIPFQWSVTESDLTSIPGIGKATAQRLLAALADPC